MVDGAFVGGNMIDWDEFDRVAYAYRAWPAEDIKGVADRYEELCQFVRSAMQDEARGARDAVDHYIRRGE